MLCSELVQRIERLDPPSGPVEAAQTWLLVSRFSGKLEELSDDRRLQAAWKDAGMRLRLLADQHAGVRDELESLASSQADRFDEEHVWTLLRAIKVQSQLLQCCLDVPPIDV